MAKERIIYYRREDEEFSGITKKTIDIDKRFKFLHKNIFWRIAAFIVYRVIMTPFAFIYCKLKFSLKTVGREKLKKFRSGCMMYSNHTLMAGDAFIPNVTTFPKKNYVIVNADNVSTPGTKNLIMMCGAIPIPTDFQAYRAFMNAIEKRLLEHACVTLYPEAHIWPYYTRIRPFPAASFRYPCKSGTPVYTMKTCYKKRAVGKLPKAVTCVDGPFCPKEELPIKQRMQALRDECYAAMCRRAEEESDYEYVKYVKLPEEKE